MARRRNRPGKVERARIRASAAIDAAECERERVIRATGGAVNGLSATPKRDRAGKVCKLTSGAAREGVGVDPRARPMVQLSKRLAAGQSEANRVHRMDRAGIAREVGHIVAAPYREHVPMLANGAEHAYTDQRSRTTEWNG